MKIPVYFTCLLLLLSCRQVIHKAKADVKHEADNYAAAVHHKDYAYLSAHIYPAALNMMGGGVQFTNLCRRLDSVNHIKFNSVKADSMGKIKTIGNRQFCLLKEVINVTVRSETIKTSGYMLAISEDQGDDWFFITDGLIATPSVYKLFPAIDGKIDLPKGVLIRNTALADSSSVKN